MSDREFELKDGYVVSKCYEDFPEIHFLFGDHWVSVYSDEYVVDISEKQDRSICALLFGQGDQPFLVMGLPTYMDYYTVHDETNNQIGFVPHKDSTKTPLEKGEQPSRAFASNSPPAKPTSIWTWVACTVIIIAFAAAWVGAVRKASYDGKKGNTTEETQKLIIWSIIAVISIAIFTHIIFAFFFPWFNDIIVADVKASYD